MATIEFADDDEPAQQQRHAQDGPQNRLTEDNQTCAVVVTDRGSGDDGFRSLRRRLRECYMDVVECPLARLSSSHLVWWDGGGSNSFSRKQRA